MFGHHETLKKTKFDVKWRKILLYYARHKHTQLEYIFLIFHADHPMRKTSYTHTRALSLSLSRKPAHSHIRMNTQ